MQTDTANAAQTGDKPKDQPEDKALADEAEIRPEDKPLPKPKVKHGFGYVLTSYRRWWARDVAGTVDQQAVIEKRRVECEITGRYLFMTAMSGGIAVLGLLLSSPAVVIGAMLLSPLMDPIMGLGFSLATGDYRWLRQSAKSLAYGSAIAVALSALVVGMSPLQEITSEIIARTRPNIFDLFVALFSALAGAYAVIRGRDGTIVGVAIATALMPPLATVGFGLATLNWTVFSGALLLFVTNFVTIALTAWGMAKLYGFHTTLSDKQTQFQNFAIIAVFIGLAVPLYLSLNQIVWEANAKRAVRTELTETFGTAARLSPPEINFDKDPITVAAFVWTTELQARADERTERRLETYLGRPVDIQLKQFLVSDESSAEAAQLASVKAQEDAVASDRVDDLGQRLAVAAGVADSEVVIDNQRRRALVRARPLAGASLATYRDLERRASAGEDDWKIELIPPMGPLPDIPFDDEGAPDPAAMDLAAWAADRLGLPVTVRGPQERAELLATGLRQRGASVDVVPGRGTVRAEWATGE